MIESFYDKAWEFVTALVGGYLALKNTPQLTRKNAAALLLVAVVVGFAAAPAVVGYVVTSGWLDKSYASQVLPFAILISAAVSLRAIGLLFSIIRRLRKSKFLGIDP